MINYQSLLKLMAVQISCLLFICYTGFSEAAVFIEVQKRQPGTEQFCIDKVEGKKYFGQQWQDPTQCVRKRCANDTQGTPIIYHEGCGVVLVEEPCKLVTPNVTKPYPECCPTPVLGLIKE